MGHNGADDPKAVTLSPEDGPSAFKLLITPINPDDNETLGSAGFGSEMLIYTLVELKPMYSTYDRHRLSNEVNCDGVKEFLYHVERDFRGQETDGIGWSDLEDGEEYVIETC